MKKIAVLCNYRLLPERVGGMDHFFWLFDAQCKTAGYQIDWFFPTISRHQGYANLDLFSSQEGNVEMYFLNHFAQNNYTHVFTHFIEISTSFFKRFKSTYDAKVIAVDHNPRPVGGYSLKKRIEKRLKGWLYSGAIDQFIGVSEYSRQQLIKELGNQIQSRTHVIFNGLPTAQLVKRTVTHFRGSFIVACHLRKDKGIQDLIEAIRIVVHRLPQVPFSIEIYGEGYYADTLKQMVQDYQLENYITFKGSVSHLYALYAQYDYLIHPSHGETFCYTVVEALLCRLPVITTKNQGNVLGLVEESINGFLYDVGNVDQLATLLQNLIANQKVLDNSVTYNTKVDALTLAQMVHHYFQLTQ